MVRRVSIPDPNQGARSAVNPRAHGVNVPAPGPDSGRALGYSAFLICMVAYTPDLVFTLQSR